MTNPRSASHATIARRTARGALALLAARFGSTVIAHPCHGDSGLLAWFPGWPHEVVFVKQAIQRRGTASEGSPAL